MRCPDRPPDRQPRDLPYDLVRHKARQLVGRYGFTKTDQPDIEQELLLHLLRRIDRFNPDKSQFSTFVDRVVNRKVATMIQHRRRQRRDYRRSAPPRDFQLHDIASEETDRDQADLWIDLEQAVSALPADLRALCERLLICNVAELTRLTSMDRGELRGMVRQLRKRFAHAGLEEYI